MIMRDVSVMRLERETPSYYVTGYYMRVYVRVIIRIGSDCGAGLLGEEMRQLDTITTSFFGVYVISCV